MRFLIKLIVGIGGCLIILSLVRRFMLGRSKRPDSRLPDRSPKAADSEIEYSAPEAPGAVSPGAGTPPCRSTPELDTGREPQSADPEESASDSPDDESLQPKDSDEYWSGDSETDDNDGGSADSPVVTPRPTSADNDNQESTEAKPSEADPSAMPKKVRSSHGKRRAVRPRAQPGRRVATGDYYPPISARLPTASLRCREGADGWELYLDIPEDREALEITQNDSPISHDGEALLLDFTGVVEIVYADGGKQSVRLSAPLYFRTDQDWSEPGRLAVQIANTGSFVVIAPVDMDGEFKDSIHAPEECTDPDFHAHFVDMGDIDREEITPGAYPMRLEGKTLFDDADKSIHGEIFVGSPPDLKVSRRIAMARVVKETGEREKNDWGVNFNPQRQTLSSALGDRDGWFSVRTYLTGARREYESRPFRYFRSLERITLGGEAYGSDIVLTPDNRNSYGMLKLRFCCGDGSSIVPKSVQPSDQRVYVWGQEVSIPPRPDVQAVSCRFENHATIEVNVPRVWWNFSDDELEYANRVREIWIDDFMRLASDNN